MHTNNNLKLGYFLVALAICGLYCCTVSFAESKHTGASLSAANRGLVAVRRVAILPVGVSSEAHGCTLGVDLYSALGNACRAELGVEVVANDELQKAAQGNGVAGVSMQQAAALANKVGADAALFATLQRCEDRVGSKLGSDSPAEVALSFVLLDAKTEAELWRGGFTSDEAPLSDNLLHLKSKIHNLHFHSAGELVQEGLRNGARELETARKKQFMTKK